MHHSHTPSPTDPAFSWSVFVFFQLFELFERVERLEQFLEAVRSSATEQMSRFQQRSRN
jgi:hypothetical protein